MKGNKKKLLFIELPPALSDKCFPIAPIPSIIITGRSPGSGTWPPTSSRYRQPAAAAAAWDCVMAAVPAAPADRRPVLPSARRLHGDHLVIKALPYHNRAAIFGDRTPAERKPDTPRPGYDEPEEDARGPARTLTHEGNRRKKKTGIAGIMFWMMRSNSTLFILPRVWYVHSNASLGFRCISCRMIRLMPQFQALFQHRS